MNRITPALFRETFPAFRKAPEALVSDILAVAKQQAYPRDMLVYSEGAACSAIAFLLSGEIRVFKTGAGGREITLYEIEKGETCILNASCILSSMPYPAHALSTEAGEMLLVPAPEFRRLISAYPEMRDFVFTILSQRLTGVMALVEEIAFGRMDRRVMEYLTEKADNGSISSTHQKIADDLGTSREVVSRILKDFERKGALSLSRNHIRLTSA